MLASVGAALPRLYYLDVKRPPDMTKVWCVFASYWAMRCSVLLQVL